MLNFSTTIGNFRAKLNPMHGVVAEQQKSLRVIGSGEKFADLIVPWGGDNRTGIHILKTYIEGIVTGV